MKDHRSGVGSSPPDNRNPILGQDLILIRLLALCHILALFPESRVILLEMGTRGMLVQIGRTRPAVILYAILREILIINV